MNPIVQELISKEYDAQRSEEWLKLRGKMLTASDLATAIGLNPYEKPKDLIFEKNNSRSSHILYATIAAAYGNSKS